MHEYFLTCCTTADLTREHFEARDISYVCFHYSLDGKSHQDDFGQTISYDDFYQAMANGASTSTTQVNIAEYLDFFDSLLAQGKDVLHVCFSSGLSGTYNSAVNAALICKERYPDRRVLVLDSLCASSGFGLFMDKLADLREEGMSIDALYQWGMEHRLEVQHWFFSTDLSAYVRGGRISKAAGVFGGILGICPLLNMNDAGKLIPREKIRSKKHAIRAIVDRMEQNAQGGLAYSGKCYISQSACMDDAKAVAALVEARFPNLNGHVEINNIGTTIGSHTGPGTIALFFFGKKRTP